MFLETNLMYNLLELERKFELSGLNGNPVISDKELKYLAERYDELVEYFSEKGERIISSYFIYSRESVLNMLRARRY